MSITCKERERERKKIIKEWVHEDYSVMDPESLKAAVYGKRKQLDCLHLQVYN